MVGELEKEKGKYVTYDCWEKPSDTKNGVRNGKNYEGEKQLVSVGTSTVEARSTSQDSTKKLSKEMGDLS